MQIAPTASKSQFTANFLMTLHQDVRGIQLASGLVGSYEYKASIFTAKK